MYLEFGAVFPFSFYCVFFLSLNSIFNPEFLKEKRSLFFKFTNVIFSFIFLLFYLPCSQKISSVQYLSLLFANFALPPT